ncbi:uncharacterized protein LOC108511293 isoform X1 [Phoenix dactylifera]|uniref:Uncharacterized protein LOC108511293 isoform X1 n=1 Tax=Phoenix dactylifera TaxID=42345 RepID=A0A8B9AE90_PHODC|nr:uncharacterized protein LOC108511293 isoform X1 [Phoenix dactylifera]
MAAQAGAGEGAARKERKARMGRRWWSSLGSGKDHGGATGEEPSTEWDYSLITAPQDPSLSLFFPLLSNLSLLATKERRNEKSVTPFPPLSLSVQWVSSRLQSVPVRESIRRSTRSGSSWPIQGKEFLCLGSLCFYHWNRWRRAHHGKRCHRVLRHVQAISPRTSTDA